MAPALEADTSFETHEWKSEFASSRSGRNSPNIFAKVRRKLLLTPPVRNARSPRLTDEELDALTGDLPYATNYTYAYSKIYDPSLPDHWEVPNLGASSTTNLKEQDHYSAASLSRQLFYILRLPIFLILHVITYILEAFYHVIKISTVSFWDYLVYLIQRAKIRYEVYQDNRRRTALIRNRQDPFSVKAGRFLRSLWEIVTFVFLLPARLFTAKKSGVEQYDYKSIKTQLETDRASRMMTRSQTQTLDRNRKFEGLSQSPSRRTPANATSTRTTVVAKVFARGATPSTSTVTTRTRTVKERSVTPRFRATRFSAHRLETPEVDTPLSTYGLRSRAVSAVNTPEPTFDIGHAAATSTPLFARSLKFGGVEQSESTLKTVASWLIYLLLTPFYFARYLGYSFYDYGKSAYMKLTDYEEEELEAIHVRDENESFILQTPGLIFIPFSRQFLIYLYNLPSRVSRGIRRIGRVVTSSLVGLASNAATSVRGLGTKTSEWAKKVSGSSGYACCHFVGILLAFLLALFLVGFITSDNTAIRAKQINFTDRAETPQIDNTIPIPTIPAYVTIGKYVTHYAWMVKEFVIDIAFETYNHLQPIGAAISSLPSSVYASVGKTADSAWNVLIGLYGTAGETAKSSTGYLSESISSVTPSFGSIFEKGLNVAYGIYSTIGGAIKYVIVGIADTSSNLTYRATKFVIQVYQGIIDAFQSFFDSYIYSPVAGLYRYLTGNYNTVFRQSFDYAARAFVKTAFMVLKYSVLLFEFFRSSVLFVVTLPARIMSQVWLYANNLTAEDMMRRDPPVDIHPTMEILKKKVEVEDEQLVIVPSPAPAPIPIPSQQPVIIQQTNVVETVDKEAIVKEVTEKLRAELSAQFHQELTTKFEQNYNTLIEKLKVENTHIQIDNSHLEGLIRQLIYEYDTDKTGQVDYALESSGGAVVSTRCSETYKSYTRLEKFWDIPIYYHHYSPRVVIQRNSKSLFPGECWCFKESRGYIAVELSHYIDVSSISYEHIGQEVAPEGNRSSAPKTLLIWAYRQIDDLNTRVLIGDYTYKLDENPLQFFIAKHKPDFPVKFIELDVTSNYGAAFTCLYRLRVHGKISN